MNIIVTNFIFPRLYYLLYGTFALITGIASQFFFQHSIASIPGAFLIAVTISIFGFIYPNAAHILRACSVGFFLGALLCSLQQQQFDNFYRLVADKTVTIQGYVSSIEKIYHKRFRGTIALDLLNIGTENGMQPCSGTIVLYLRDLPDLMVGDTIHIHDVSFKKTPAGPFANYLLKEKIAATLFKENIAYNLIKRPTFNLNRILAHFKNKILYHLKTKINGETFQLFSSIFLGNRTIVKKQMDSTKEPFKVWGTSHYLARSGLHLVIFVIIWHFILAMLPLSYIFKELFLLFLIATYALLSWSSVSFERALLMVVIYKLCTIFGSACHYIHLIILVTGLVLCYNPYQLFFLDFQLSFGLTFALAWFNYIQARKKLSYS
jgi:ComEC/Rec2-related protein